MDVTDISLLRVWNEKEARTFEYVVGVIHVPESDNSILAAAGQTRDCQITEVARCDISVMRRDNAKDLTGLLVQGIHSVERLVVLFISL